MITHSDPYKEFYYTTLMGELKDYWKRISIEGIKPNPNEKPWFGNIEPKWKNVYRRTAPNISRCFTHNLRENVGDLAQNAGYLLPEISSVKAALPVLLCNFFSNWGKPYANFVTLLKEESYYSDQHSKFEAVLKTGEKLWIAPSLKKAYGKLTGNDFSIDNVKRILPVYLKAIQFLVFLQYASNSRYVGSACNVSLSFYSYESMTGYLHLLGADARDYVSKIDKAIGDSSSAPESLFAQVEETYGERIKKYICDYVEDFYANDFPKNEPSGEKQYRWTPNFLTYLANLKVELSPPEFTFRENDPLGCYHTWDQNLETRLSEETVIGIFDRLPKETQDALEELWR